MGILEQILAAPDMRFSRSGYNVELQHGYILNEPNIALSFISKSRISEFDGIVGKPAIILFHIFIDVEKRRRGFFRRLLRELEDYATARGIFFVVGPILQVRGEESFIAQYLARRGYIRIEPFGALFIGNVRLEGKL